MLYCHIIIRLMFIPLVILSLCLTSASDEQYDQVDLAQLNVNKFNITGYLIGIVYGFFDSIDFYQGWNCSNGIIGFYYNITVAIGKVQRSGQGVQMVINILDMVISILNSTIWELQNCGNLVNEFLAIGRTFIYMFSSPHVLEDLGENFIRCSPFFLFYYEQMMKQMFVNSTASGYYTILGFFDTFLLTSYSRQIGATLYDNCDLEGFKHSIWST